MEIKFIFLCICLILTGYPAQAIEQEPNWTNRYRDVRQELLTSFKPVMVGQKITIIRRVGGEYTGKIDSLSSASVVVDGKVFLPRQLTDETCDKLFSNYYASRIASQQVLKERAAYRQQQIEEQRKAQEAIRIARAEEQKKYEEAKRTAVSSVATHSSDSKPPNNRPSTSSPTTPTEPANTSSANGNSLMWGILVIIIVFFSISAARRKIRKETIINQAKAFVATVQSRKKLTPISTNILLKNGEEAYLESVCSLNETRAVRHYQSGGVGVRIAKGIYIGGSQGKSVSIPEMARIDSGKLVLTNKKLVFDGSTDDRTIPLDKIVSINNFIDAIEVSVEGRQKSMYFTVPNPLVWFTAIRILSSGHDPKDLSGVDLNIKFD